MKKIVIISLFVLVGVGMMFSQAKPGGIARQASMGGSMAGSGLVLNPFIMDDPALILLNPAYQGMYRDYFWSNIAGGRVEGNSSSDNGYGNQNAGLAFGLSDACVVGTILSYDPSAANALIGLLRNYPQNQRGYWQTIPQIQNVWEILGAHKFTSMTLGFGLMYGWSNHNDKYSYLSPNSNNEYSMTAYMFGLRAGLLWEVNPDFLLDVTGHLRFDNANDKITGAPAANQLGEYEASATELLFYARAKMKVTSKFNFVPYGMFGYGTAEPKEKTVPDGHSNATATLKYTSTNYALGVGGEYRTSTFYLAGGISYQHFSLESDLKAPGNWLDTLNTTQSYTGIPVINLGGEWWFTEWLAGRIGYFRSIGSDKLKNEYPRRTYEHNISDNFSSIFVGGLNGSSYDGIVTLGVGFKFGGFAIDATVSDEALRRGLGLIGSNNGINTFGYMTASYNFAE